MILPALDVRRAEEIVRAFRGLPVLVAGDVMLDRFITGTVTRTSPEAPVPVVRFRSEHARLGGAANVAHNLVALGARVSLVGVVGADAGAARLRRELDAAGLSAQGLIEDATRPTIEKVRVVTERNQQVTRIDYEDDDPVGSDVEAQIVSRLTGAASGVRALVVSDYLKGVITPGVMRALVALKQAGTPLLVDPKVPHLESYTGATLVTPNSGEAEAATGRRLRSDDDARLAARDILARVRCDAVLITRGEQGMWLSCAGIDGGIPAVAREVADVTGAGDTVIAVLALAVAAGATLQEAAVLANHAAGVVVGRFGPATVSPDELLTRLTPAV